jgi:hypothetical protein
MCGAIRPLLQYVFMVWFSKLLSISKQDACLSTGEYTCERHFVIKNLLPIIHTDWTYVTTYWRIRSLSLIINLGTRSYTLIGVLRSLKRIRTGIQWTSSNPDVGTANVNRKYIWESISKSFRTQSITKCMLTIINTRWEAIQRVIAAKLPRLTHKMALQLHLVSESCNICSSRSRRRPESFGYILVFVIPEFQFPSK